MRRRLKIIATVLWFSLIICIVALWFFGGEYHLFSALSRSNDRRTLGLQGSRLVFCEPPSSAVVFPSPRSADKVAREILSYDVRFTIRCKEEGSLFHEGRSTADGVFIKYDSDYVWPELDEIARPMLRALEDPQTALAAHAALCLRRPSSAMSIEPQPIKVGGSYTIMCDGMRITLHPLNKYRPKSDWIMYDATGEMMQEDLPAVRKRWHRRLDVVSWSFDLRLLLIPLALFPLARLALAIIRHRRRQRRWLKDQCLVCGYDLRGIAERCLECGAAAEQRRWEWDKRVQMTNDQ